MQMISFLSLGFVHTLKDIILHHQQKYVTEIMKEKKSLEGAKRILPQRRTSLRNVDNEVSMDLT